MWCELTSREGFLSSRRKDWVCGSQEYRAMRDIYPPEFGGHK
jgi:hypothetical protein